MSTAASTVTRVISAVDTKSQSLRYKKLNRRLRRYQSQLQVTLDDGRTLVPHHIHVTEPMDDSEPGHGTSDAVTAPGGPLLSSSRVVRRIGHIVKGGSSRCTIVYEPPIIP